LDYYIINTLGLVSFEDFCEKNISPVR